MKKYLSLSVKILSFFILISFMACQGENTKEATSSNSSISKMRDYNDAVFISHEGIAKGVTKQIWKEIVFGDYNVEDLKLFNLGKQTSELGAKDPYQIITYGYQIQNDPEIFRVSLRSDLKDGSLYYQLNEKEYYNCTEQEYDPNFYSIQMKTAISQILADDFLKRKILELER